jgi:chorismate mutase
MKIIDWRTKIDAIDTALLHLLNLRTELALEVGRLKASEGVALRVPAREQEILARMKSLNPGPLKNDSIVKIYQVILDESIATQVLHGVGKAEPVIGSVPESAPEKATGPRTGRVKKDRRWRK